MHIYSTKPHQGSQLGKFTGKFIDNSWVYYTWKKLKVMINDSREFLKANHNGNCPQKHWQTEDFNNQYISSVHCIHLGEFLSYPQLLNAIKWPKSALFGEYDHRPQPQWPIFGTSHVVPFGTECFTFSKHPVFYCIHQI